MPLVSVVMTTYDETKKELNNSINSILNQTFKHFELIIVDDNPKSLKLKKYLIDEKKKDDRILIVFN